MSFADNLKKLRSEHRLTQEDLADLLHVSRQAVSKWEQSLSYPEAENLILLSKKFGVSLDLLLETGAVMSHEQNGNALRILSPHENVTVLCVDVVSSGKFHGGKNTPKYALYALSQSNGKSDFWTQGHSFLGWYKDEEEISREIRDIHAAIDRRDSSYILKYSLKTSRKLGTIKIKE